MRRLIRLLTAMVMSVPMLTAVVFASSSPSAAEDNGVGRTPLMGWSSWSYIRKAPTAAKIEAQADALKSSGLYAAGYRNINVDDFWYVCPGSQGADVDEYGRWVIDKTKFPDVGSKNGIEAVADHVHGLGEKFGLYLTPGISSQAVAQNTPIEGTSYHAADIATTTKEANYNCGGMVGIDYTKPGAQAFIDSWADQLASWGVDYLKLDGVGSSDIPDVQAWSDALKQTGRPIHLELSNSLNIDDAATWSKLANGWRTGGDVECYCGTDADGNPDPLTSWSSVALRFDQAANWAPYGGPGGFNDYDSIEVGNGDRDGLTPTERQTQLSLWALAASPLILGTDLTNLDQGDLALLKNTDVIAVDQDSIDAKRIRDADGQQIFTKTEPNGDAIVGLFNTTNASQQISTSTSALGVSGRDYAVRDLWTHKTTETVGRITADVPAHGVALYRVSRTHNPTAYPPLTEIDLTGLTGLTPGKPASGTVSFTDDGALPVQKVSLRLSAPSGWKVVPTSRTSFGSVASGRSVRATYRVTPPASTQPTDVGTLTSTATYTWPRRTRLSISQTTKVAFMHYVYSQQADESYKRLTREIDVPAGGGALTFSVDRDTEQDWDFMFVEAHTPGKDDWTTLPDQNGHTSTAPGESCANGWIAQLHPQLAHYQTLTGSTCTSTGTTGSWNAATGKSAGWEQWKVDLSKWAGRSVEVSIAYASDWGTQGTGVFLDDLTAPDGTTASFEDGGLDGWTVPGPPPGDTGNVNDYVVSDPAHDPLP